MLELRPPGSPTYEFCSLEEDLDVCQDNDVNCWSKNSCIQFLLIFKEVGQMPQGVISDLQSDITMLVENALDALSSNVRGFLEQNNVVVEGIDGLQDILQASDLRKPFEGLESEYLQKRAFHSLGLVVCSIFILLI